MKDWETKAAVGMILTIWPPSERSPFPEESVQAWGALLDERRFSLEDWNNALRLICEQARMFRPHVSEVAEIAGDMWRDRLASAENALTAGEEADPRLRCCRQAENGFKHWLMVHATAKERKAARKVAPTLAAKYGIELDKLEEQTEEYVDRKALTP